MEIPPCVDFTTCFSVSLNHTKAPIQLPLLASPNLEPPMTPPPPPRAVGGDRRSPAVDDDSRKIHKSSKRKPPVVIYMVSPEVIHVEASEFMALVQRLTGPGAAASDDPSASISRQVVPVRVKAARALTQRPPMAAQTPVTSSAASETLFFHDLSPPSTFAVRKDEQMATPHGWLLHGESSP